MTAGGASHVANTAISDTTDTVISDTEGGLAGGVAMVVINTGGGDVETAFEEKGSSGDPGGNNKKDQVRPKFSFQVRTILAAHVLVHRAPLPVSLSVRCALFFTALREAVRKSS